MTVMMVAGHLFHIDFGYILGHDPKPYPPPMKIIKEMVEAMGGAGSAPYNRFQTLACEAFNRLRKFSNLILNLFVLMVDANIPDLSGDPEKALLNVRSIHPNNTLTPVASAEFPVGSDR